MPRIGYKTKRFSAEAMAVIAWANRICQEYAQQGFDLTLRQLYYQFVARDLIPNTDRDYKRLGSIVNDARMAGELDWYYIVDRTRNLRGGAHWDSPADIIRSSAAGYAIDKWAEQGTQVEVWIEKDALLGVIEGICRANDVSYFSCRGYTSQSEVWRAGRRLGAYIDAGKDVEIIHLGDHDPSGIDMTRDIEERLVMFMAGDYWLAHEDELGEDASTEVVRTIMDRFKVNRIALTWDQIEEYGPPPNPAKVTDSRARSYIAKYGYESWELDALEPSVLAGLIQSAIDDVRDAGAWEVAETREAAERKTLTAASDRWSDVVAFLNPEGSDGA